MIDQNTLTIILNDHRKEGNRSKRVLIRFPLPYTHWNIITPDGRKTIDVIWDEGNKDDSCEVTMRWFEVMSPEYFDKLMSDGIDPFTQNDYLPPELK